MIVSRTLLSLLLVVPGLAQSQPALAQAPFRCQAKETRRTFNFSEGQWRQLNSILTRGPVPLRHITGFKFELCSIHPYHPGAIVTQVYPTTFSSCLFVLVSIDASGSIIAATLKQSRGTACGPATLRI